DEISQIEEIAKLVQLEKKFYQGVVHHPSLLEFYQEIELLTQFSSPQELPPLPEDKFSWIKIIPKKQHEIKKLAPLVDHYYRQENVERIIDIGGGIGLLSQTLAKSYHHKITSLDMDQELQLT